MDTEYSDWQIDAHFFDKQSSSHWVLLRHRKESNGWQNFRLCVLGTLRKKRSYWIAWNPSEQRFAKGSEENHMNQYNVELKQRLEEYLLKFTEALQDAAEHHVPRQTSRAGPVRDADPALPQTKMLPLLPLCRDVVLGATCPKATARSPGRGATASHMVPARSHSGQI